MSYALLSRKASFPRLGYLITHFRPVDMFLRRKPVFMRQKIADYLPEYHEFRKIGRLTEIAVGAKRVHFLAVAP